MTANDYIDVTPAPDGTELLGSSVPARGTAGQLRSDCCDSPDGTDRRPDPGRHRPDLAAPALLSLAAQPSREPAMGSRSKPVEAPLLAEGLPCGARRAVPAQLVGVAAGGSGRRRRWSAGGRGRGRASPRPSGRGARRRGSSPGRRRRPAPPRPRPWPARPRGGSSGPGPRRRPWRPSRGCPGKPSDESPTTRQPIRDGLRRDAPLLADAGLVIHDPAAAVPQHDPLVADELGHVLVRRADEDPLDRRLVAEAARRPRRSRHRPRTRPSARATIPSASTAASAIGNWASSSGGIPADDL